MFNNPASQTLPLPTWKMEPVWNNIGSQKPLLPTKRKPATEPLSPSVVDKRVIQMEPHVNRRPTQLQSMSSKSGPQRVQTPKSRTANQEISPKVKSGSFEAVRSKMRETLAAALSVDSQNQEKASNEDNNAPSEAQPLVDEEPAASTTAKINENGKNDGEEPQYNYVMPDADSSFGDSFFVKDELLQGNGLSWAWDMETTELKEVNGSEQGQSGGDIGLNANETENNAKSPQELASKIETELFKLFGGVNKKYKEKGRSLMFNLKDRSNPELREKVLSGAISPERLCSMTPEELASKELSEWRVAKAEALDKMIVLPDSDVDIRRLVKKTHKGEYQVEVEQDDAISVEVSLGESSLFTHFQPKKKKTKPPSSEAHEVKDKEITDGDKSSSLTIPADGTDFMQELIVEEFKDEGFLPPIVSLDEFMESLDSEPPFENLPVDSKVTKPVADKTISETDVKTDIEKASAEPASADRTDQPKAKTTAISLTKKTSPSVERKTLPVSSAVIGVHVWEGELQLTISSSISSIGLFRSGEKTSTKEWPGSIEIKGRVRLDAFEKFLQELPMSRTRAVMVVHFALKDSSSEDQRALLSEAVDSYIGDERLGFGEPIPGVEVYFCPPHTNIIEMLCRHLSKNQTDILKSTDNGLIGVVVWRRPLININNHSSSSHKRHKTHNFPTRRQENIISNTNLNNVNSRLPTKSNNDNVADDEDDIPPGFGPGAAAAAAAAAARDEDDLPEFSFSGNSNISRQNVPAQVGFGSNGPQSNTSRPVDQMRQLIHRYGQTANDEDDDMPEWQPQLPQNHPTHNIQQAPFMPHMVNQIRPAIGQVMSPHMNIQPSVNVLQNVVRWPAPPANGSVPGQTYVGGQWRQDTPRSRGF